MGGELGKEVAAGDEEMRMETARKEKNWVDFLFAVTGLANLDPSHEIEISNEEKEAIRAFIEQTRSLESEDPYAGIELEKMAEQLGI